MLKPKTYHVLHEGRATYTLVYPPSTVGSAPRVENVTMGTDASKGEVRQLVVGTGVWKMSRLPLTDLQGSGADAERVGCLITEVVVPGFHWEDHKYLTRSELLTLWKGVEGGEQRIKEMESFVKDG